MIEGFDGPELVMGSIYGVRHFRPYQNGQLMSAAQYESWRDGENVSRCLAGQVKPKSWKRSQYCIDEHGEGHDLKPSTLSILQRWIDRPDEAVDCIEVDEWEEPHPSPQPSCGCGYWAYYSAYVAESPYDSGNIPAVIEGYGKTVIGTKGFRCERAKIVAMVLPPAEEKKPEEPAEPVDLKQREMFEEELRIWKLSSILPGVIAILFAFAALANTPWLFFMEAAPLALGAVNGWHVWDIHTARRVHGYDDCAYQVLHGSSSYVEGRRNCCSGRLRKWSKREVRVLQAQREARATSVDTYASIWKLLRRNMWGDAKPNREATIKNYPDVVVFDSVESMLAQYPVDKPDLADAK